MTEHRSGTHTRGQITGSTKDSFNSNDVKESTSLSTLILWNISKAQEKNPAMNLKDAIIAAQARLDRERDMSAMIPDSAEQRHLACAVLAWQQLGHSDADSLYQFIANKTKAQEPISSNDAFVISSRESKYSKDVHSMSFGSNTVGPVVKLPVETKIVMRMDNSPSARQQTTKKPKAPEKNTMNKIEAACCLDSACAERLAKMDTATAELRMRAGMLARREAERVELLERAEAAWGDLELGYQRRLTLSEEKEEDLTKQIQKAVQERNGYKNACTSLASQLKEKGDKAEKERAALSQVEKELCERACLRLKLCEEASQGDAVLAEHQCRATQLERDLMFKEEQARRKLLNFQSELESSQTITHETERAMRAELGALREQIAEVSQQLLEEDAVNTLIKTELENLLQEKMGMVEDLECCKATCDSRMQGKVDELKKKRDQLGELKDKVMECRCKLPVDATVEVKRTASLAALCRCTPEEKIMGSCSCTSLRDRLLSNLLKDLFSGLQAEMDGTGSQMPCQLLKCLEDRHNWDRASIVKTNLKNYFSQLLIGELDIAIATSIEKYHAKWVGQSCADTARMIPDPGDAENEGWQERLIERRAQNLATKLAEQLFQERADELTQRAKDIVSSGPPPCECKPRTACQSKGVAAVYPVLLSGRPMSPAPVPGPTTPANTPAYWRQTMQDVTRLRTQIEDLKKDSIKKEDLKLMEEKITKIVQRGSGTGKADVRQNTLVSSSTANDTIVRKEQKVNRAMNSNLSNNNLNPNKSITPKKKQIDLNNTQKRGSNIISSYGSDKTFKPYKKHGQTYAINMCMCSQKDPSKITQQNKILSNAVVEEGRGGTYRNDRKSKDSLPQMTSSVKQTKPINASLQSQDISIRTNSKSSGQQSCRSDCKCFHKIPSNTSIDKLLETLAKWKSDLNPCETEKECENEMPCCNFLPGNEISRLSSKNTTQNDLNMLICCKNNDELEQTHNTAVNPIQKGTKVSDIDEESAVDSKISSRSSHFAENTEQSKNSPSPSYDKRSSINNTNHERADQIKSSQIPFNDKRSSINGKSSFSSKTPSELDQETKIMDNKNNKKTVTADTSSNGYSSKKEDVKSKSSKGVCCDSDTNPNNMDSRLVAPTTTESEYMGAINLDKSNEDICKCVDRNKITGVPPNELFQCMPCKCSCKSSKAKKTIQDINNPDVSFNELKSQDKSQKITNNTQKKIIPEKNNSQNKSDENKVKKQETFSCDCGYNIQFLGVTLTDVTNETDTPYDDNEEQIKNFENENDSNKDKTYRGKAPVILEQPADAKETNNEINDKDEKKAKKGERCEKCQLMKRKPKKDNNIKESCKSMPSCECKGNFDEFKNLIEVAFQKKQTNEDKGLDVQSFKESKKEEDFCICCNKQNIDESEDLEENTFHLLEEHLKKKLEEFKETSCNSTCIPPEEEEKLFNAILMKVKQIITDSTNKIACKCGNGEENSKGSWNRAYGLLQEYLKTKIQRVQCSCVLAEDNTNDTILPEVLDKVCNSIEHDFQRLKDVCGCKKSELQGQGNKQVYFKEEVPVRDNDLLNNKINKQIDSCCCENPQSSVIIKENTSSQVPAYFGMETKSCNPLETYAKNVQTIENAKDSFKSLDATIDCNYYEKKADAELFTNLPYVAYASECICKDTECTNSPKVIDITTEDDKKCINKQKCCRVKKNADAELLGINETKTNQPTEPAKNDCVCNPTSTSDRFENNEITKKNNVKSESLAHFPSKPYIGYTIDCSCDTALGACVCVKSNFQADNIVMENIINKSMPNDKYYEKVSYIMKSDPKNSDNYYHNDLLSDMTGDLYLHNVLKHKTLYDDDYKHDCETEAVYDNEDITLKSSRDYFEMAHTTTNTFDDNTSGDTDYSNTEAPLDWCECCSQMPNREMNSDQLKHSIYYPAPLGNDSHSVKNKHSASVSKKLTKYCDCDLVPICHVKMLVENIENKLVGAKCTCDSMTPKVCPIHSTRF